MRLDAITVFIFCRKYCDYAYASVYGHIFTCVYASVYDYTSVYDYVFAGAVYVSVYG